MIKEFLFKRKMKKNEIEILKVSDKVIELYRSQVRNNKDLDTEQITRKINRNFILGTTVKNGTSTHIKYYGNLEITYSKIDKEIVKIWNNRGDNLNFNIDTVERARLTKLMGIKEDR